MAEQPGLAGASRRCRVFQNRSSLARSRLLYRRGTVALINRDGWSCSVGRRSGRYRLTPTRRHSGLPYAELVGRPRRKVDDEPTAPRPSVVDLDDDRVAIVEVCYPGV